MVSDGYQCINVYIDHYILIGSGIDFNSNPFNITINAGATDGRANVSVTCDDVIEERETFDMRLTLVTTNSQLSLGTSTSVGEIIDSTGKWTVCE